MQKSVNTTVATFTVSLQFILGIDIRVIPQENEYIIASIIDSLLGARKSQPNGNSRTSQE